MPGLPGWPSLSGGPQASCALAHLGALVPDLGVAAVVIAGLWLLKRRRTHFFLAKGQVDAPIRPVPWLGIGKGDTWRAFAWIFAFAAGLAVLIPTALSIHVSSVVLARAAPLLPVAVVFAAINAFTKEVHFRATLLSTLHDVIGRSHALFVNIALFGLAHYLYGSPPGLIGFLLTGFLAFLFGKSMLETRGLAWSLFIRFVPDVVIFASYAILWVQPWGSQDAERLPATRARPGGPTGQRSGP